MATAETHSEDAKDEGKAAAAEASDGPPSDEPEETAARDSDAPEEPKKTEPEKERILPKGNALRWKRGGITALVGGLGAFLLMAHNGQLRFGVPIGFSFMLVVVWGVLDLCGSFDDDVEPAGRLDTQQIIRALLGVGGAGLVFCGCLMGGQGGSLKQWIWGALVTLSFELLVYAIFNLGVKLGPWAKDETGLARPIWQRHGFWLVTVAALLYLPRLGSYSLWDPWETHYGEVAREILARNDWISTWWAQDGWFWSKPILDF